MGRFTYYSPILFGVLLIFSLYRHVLAYAPAWPEPWPWAFVACVALGAGLCCQLSMLAAQGAFAQVLPVPGGRSIRGRGAVLAGWLLLAGIVFGLAAVLLAVERVQWPAWLAFLLGIVAIGGAVITYIWQWPTAVRDFAEQR